MPYSINQWFSKEKKTNQSLYSDKAFQVNAHALCSYKNLFVLTIPGKQNILTNIIDKENIIPVKDYTLKYDELIKTCELFRITNKTTLEEMANVSLDAAENYCNTVPNTIWENIIKLRLVKIDKNFFNSVKKNNCYYNKTI